MIDEFMHCGLVRFHTDFPILNVEKLGLYFSDKFDIKLCYFNLQDRPPVT